MRSADLVGLCWTALREHRLRTLLSLTGIAISVAAVLVLGALGEGTRRYVVSAFSQFGTNLLSVSPGKTETLGLPGALGGTTHDLDLEDSLALGRLPRVRVAVPSVFGQARVEGNGRGRRVSVLGTTADALEVWKLGLARGTFLPPGDPRRGANVAVLGSELARELFGEESPLGARIRVGGRRMRVVGVTEERGELLGFDMDDLAYVPVSQALALFDQEGLTEIDVVFGHESETATVEADVAAVLRDRHGGQDDVTIVTQTAFLDVLDRVLRGVTWAVTAIAAVSLLVGAIGILTTMWIAVGQRTSEIGLLRALGGTLRDVQTLFLVEAVLLALAGGACGLAAGLAIASLFGWIVPDLPVHVPAVHVAAALAVSAATGLFAGVAPARRAARLDPLEALREE